MFDMLNKMGDLKRKMEEIKKRLDGIYIDEHSPDGMITATVTGNRKVKGVNINAELLKPENKEQLEELLEITINRALERAEQSSESEMKAAGRDLLPGFPGF